MLIVMQYSDIKGEVLDKVFCTPATKLGVKGILDLTSPSVHWSIGPLSSFRFRTEFGLFLEILKIVNSNELQNKFEVPRYSSISDRVLSLRLSHIFSKVCYGGILVPFRRI
jgi:hypothetical protein